MSDSSTLGKYRLCPNSAVKFTFFLGLLLQSATLALAIAMLTQHGWIAVQLPPSAQTSGNRYTYSRVEGILQDCFPDGPPSHFQPRTWKDCYMKDFGQYPNTESTNNQIDITRVGGALVSLGLLSCAFVIGMGAHLAFIWFRAPYDSFFMRAYRLLVGFSSAISSCLFLAMMVVFHVNLRSSVQRIIHANAADTSISLRHGYYIAWGCVGASVLAAWTLVSSTCCWAIDYVNCHSVAAAYYPTCSHRASTLSMNNCLRSSVYSLNNDGVWSVQDQPTLPRYHTSTYGDGIELRNKSAKEPESDVKETKEATQA